MTFQRILNLRLLRRNLRQLLYYSSTSQFKNVNQIGFTIGALSIGGAVTTTLLYKKAKCLSTNESESTVPRRLQRFLSFASVEYQGCVYMTPQDLLDSLILDQPRGIHGIF